MTKFMETTSQKIQEKLNSLQSDLNHHNQFSPNPFKSEQLTLALAKLIEFEEILFTRRE